MYISALSRGICVFSVSIRSGERDLSDEAIVQTAVDEKRIILTRDKGILKNGRVTHGYWLRATDPKLQLEEVIGAIDLADDVSPYTRCMECNGELVSVKRSEVARSVPLQVFLVYRDFTRCTSCHRVYWRGSHLRRLDKIVERAKNAASAGKPTEEPCGRLRR